MARKRTRGKKQRRLRKAGHQRPVDFKVHVEIITAPWDTAYSRAERVFERYAKHLFEYPGVVGVALAPEISKGLKTGRFAIQVHVVRKPKTQNAVPRSSIRLPERIDGIPVDVIQCKYRHSAGPTVQGGMQIEPTSQSDGHGLLGLLVKRVGTTHGLTAAHVVAGTRPISAIGTVPHPILMKNNTGQIIGQSESGPNDFRQDGRTDCALVGLAPGAVIQMGIIPGMPQPVGFRDVTAADVLGGTVVHRPDATLPGPPFFRVGKIISIRSAISVDGLMTTDQIEVENADSSNRPFAIRGDSGGIICDLQNRIVGLIRGVDDAIPPTATLACRIPDVFAALNVTIA